MAKLTLKPNGGGKPTRLRYQPGQEYFARIVEIQRSSDGIYYYICYQICDPTTQKTSSYAESTPVKSAGKIYALIRAVINRNIRPADVDMGKVIPRLIGKKIGVKFFADYQGYLSILTRTWSAVFPDIPIDGYIRPPWVSEKVDDPLLANLSENEDLMDLLPESAKPEPKPVTEPEPKPVTEPEPKPEPIPESAPLKITELDQLTNVLTKIDIKMETYTKNISDGSTTKMDPTPLNIDDLLGDITHVTGKKG